MEEVHADDLAGNTSGTEGNAAIPYRLCQVARFCCSQPQTPKAIFPSPRTLVRYTSDSASQPVVSVYQPRNKP